MRSIGVVTMARSDYSCYLSVLRSIQEDADMDLQLFVGGMHLSPEFGLTIRLIEQDGFPVAERVEMLLSSDTAEGVAKSMGMGTLGFAQAFRRTRPDILLVLGDRFEMHSAVVAALPFKIPVAHIHGGESTEGALDESFRHSITKMSHLHFVSTEAYGRRVIQMGEEPWRVIVSGAPALDSLAGIELLSPQELGEQAGIDLSQSPLLVTFHPVTLHHASASKHIQELLAALADTGLPMVFTYPNADADGRLIIENIREFAAGNESAQVVTNLGTRGYFSLMSHALAMVGNSSSGIIEASSFGLPVVNIGDRQLGRVRPENVVDVGHSNSEIRAGIEKVTSTGFRASLDGLKNPYGDGNAANRIVGALKKARPDHELLHKSFHEINRADNGVGNQPSTPAQARNGG